VVPTDTPTSTSTPTGTTVPCTDNAAYVADVTVPDGAVFNAGASISKAWRLRNSGTCSWGGGYRLQFISGDKMSAPDSQAVVLTDPGNITDITVEMIAPSAPGDHAGSWRMVNNKGQAFGQTVTVHIKVPFPPTATGIATATSTATTVPPPPGPGPLPPGPGPTPVIEFWADSGMIQAGSETTLHARVENVAAAWLDGEPVVGGHKDKTVNPCVETTYTLDVMLPGGAHVQRVKTIQVTGSCMIQIPGWQFFQTPTNTPWFVLVNPNLNIIPPGP
jgi:hypothetical protein